MEQTLLIIKPRALDNEIEIVSQLKRKGFKINQKRKVQITKEQATDFYEDKMNDIMFNEMIDSITNGPAVALLVEKLDVFDEIPQIIGNENPSIAAIENQESLRARFGLNRIQNGIHISPSKEAALREIQFFFPNNTFGTIPTPEEAKMYLEDAVYPTLLEGLTALCREKPENPSVAQDQNLATKLGGSNSSLKGDDEGGLQQTNDDWLPPKTLLKPAGQMNLIEKELSEEFTRILNANNPHAPQNISRYSNKENTFKTVANMEHVSFHFEFDGYLVYSANEEGEELTDEQRETRGQGTGEPIMGAGEIFVEEQRARQPLRNQFNYSERAAQTVNNPYRERSTNTEPPPQRPFSHTVNQWSIHDDYLEDIHIKEKAAKEKAKGAGAGKNSKDEEKNGILPDGHAEDLYYKNGELRKAMVIAERMANQNSFDDISQDFKYWEDASDELGDKKSGSLLPLWKFQFQKEKQKQVTAVCWSPIFPDLFAVGYGSYDFSHQGPGMVVLFTLKNPSFPEFIYQTESGVMSVHIHPQHPSMIAVGLYDGSVQVYNIQAKTDQPVFKSSRKSGGKHTDPVWQVCWQKDDLDENLVFFSVSSDGRVIQWTLLKNELLHTDVISLKYEHTASEEGLPEDEKLFSLAGGVCFDFHKKSDHLFVVGTEEGCIYKCSKEYSSEHVLSFLGHSMSVYTVKYNPFHEDYFLSASADWSVKIWNHNDSKCIMTFDLNSSVGDVAWAPYSSTIFAAVTTEGKVFVFDLSVNKYAAICEQPVVKKAKLTHISFNPFEPILLVGDEKGQMISLKLSPNLRNKKRGSGEEEAEKLQNVINAVKGVSAY